MWNEQLFFIALGCALFIYMLDFGLGHPADERLYYTALFFGWTFFLAKKRLQRMGEYSGYVQQYKEQLQIAENGYQKAALKKNFQAIVVQKAREFHTWESCIGMCPYCTHFWFTLIFIGTVNYFYFLVNIFNFILYLCISHLLIRLIKKV